MCAILTASMSGSGAGDDGTQSLATYPISSDVYTTRQRTIVPDTVTAAGTPILPYDPSNPNAISPFDPAAFQANGYGSYHYGPGVDYGKNLSIMPAGYNASSATNAASLLNFFTMSDVHIYDKESPSQPFYDLMKDVGGSIDGLAGISYTMLDTTQTLDAAVQTANALDKQKPFDFGLNLGDVANDSQYNETRWYIDVMDGKVITPSSGDNAGADTIPYQEPFQAAGLDKTIPWYQVKGNHDNEWFGTAQQVGYLQQSHTSGNILQLGDIFTDPNGYNERTYDMGTVDGSTPYGNIIDAGPASTTSPLTVAADPNRRSLTKDQWMSEFSNTSSNPVGHGFTPDDIANDTAYYSFEPKSDIPIKVIVLDDIQNVDDPNLSTYGNGSLDETQYNWLINQLDEGQADGQLMIIAAHCAIGVEPYGSGIPGSWGPDSYVTDDQLIDKLQTYPNLVLWLAGHEHINQVTPFPSPDPSQPDLGFWEVQTPSLRDFPQEFRTFDIERNTDNTISTIITDVDPAVSDGTPAADSRSYAIAGAQLYNSPSLASSPNGGVYNAELLKQLSPEMQLKIQNYGTQSFGLLASA